MPKVGIQSAKRLAKKVEQSSALNQHGTDGTVPQKVLRSLLCESHRSVSRDSLHGCLRYLCRQTNHLVFEAGDRGQLTHACAFERLEDIRDLYAPCRPGTAFAPQMDL